MRTIYKKLNMKPGGIPLLIRLNQYDSDFSIVFTLYSSDNTWSLESGTTAKIRGTKKSGTGYSADATVDTAASTVTVTGDAQMTAAAGQNIFEVVLHDGDAELSSANFVIYCERAAMDADTITDETVLAEITDFDTQIAAATAAATAAETAQAAAEAAAAEAQEIIGITVDSEMSSTSTNPVQNRAIYDEISTLKEDLDTIESTVADLSTSFSNILVEDHGDGEQATLTNAENATAFYGATSHKGLEATSISSGVALFTSTSDSETSPYIAHLCALGEGKWLVSFKYRFTKVDSTLGDPENVRVGLGASDNTDADIDWGNWVEYSNVAEIDLTRIRIAARNFGTAPTAGQFTLEIKEMYVYEVTGVSNEMIAEIQSEQSSNYQDGTVTYGEATTTTYVPDTSLATSGKAADSKATGDAIAAVQTALESEIDDAVAEMSESVSDVLTETSVTLANTDALANLDAAGGFQRDSIATNLAVFSPSSSPNVSPAIRHLCSYGSGKWMVGFKFRVTKNDSTLGDPAMYRLILGASDTHDYTVVYDTWVTVCEVSSVDLTRVYFCLRNYSTAPTSGQITLEVKDYYVYEVSEVSADLISYIESQQASSYTDGQVTYTIKDLADSIKLNLGRVNALNYGITGDGTTDDTAAINAMFTAVGSANYYFPAGTYLFSDTIYPPADSTIYGDGDTTIFKLADTHSLSQESFRGATGGWYPYFDAVNVDNLNIRKIKVIGSNSLDEGRHAAILLKYCTKCTVSEVTVYNVNFDDTQALGGTATVSGYGIAVDMSEMCTVEKCYVERCGYECIGIVDACSDCVVRDCVTKDGWRTCVQIHRGSKRTIIDNVWMEETHTACDACFTLHGLEDSNLIEDVRVTNCTMIYPSGIEQVYNYNAPAQCMSYTHRFWFCNNRIYGGRRALFLAESFEDVFICNNQMYCDDQSDYGVRIESAGAIIIGNRLVNDAGTSNTLADSVIQVGNDGID